MFYFVVLIAAITVISAKAVSGFAVLLLRGSLSIPGLLSQPVLYFLLLCTVITGITQVKYVQDALALYPATFVVPVNYILFTLSAITAGIIFYGELIGLGEVNIIIFIIGCVLCFAGVFLITDDGRACTALSQTQSSAGIATEMSSYGGANTEQGNVNSQLQQQQQNQNKVITLLRDCVKLTQTKFELQPLLHSSPQNLPQQQQQKKDPEDGQLGTGPAGGALVRKQYSNVSRKTVGSLAVSERDIEPSPISKYATSINGMQQSDCMKLNSFNSTCLRTATTTPTTENSMISSSNANNDSSSAGKAAVGDESSSQSSSSSSFNTTASSADNSRRHVKMQVLENEEESVVMVSNHDNSSTITEEKMAKGDVAHDVKDEGEEETGEEPAKRTNNNNNNNQ